jgi:hypothetical protein
MITATDPRLRDEARRFALRFACEDCAHQEDGGGCSLGFPPEPRHATELEERPRIRFCKTFELA